MFELKIKHYILCFKLVIVKKLKKEATFASPDGENYTQKTQTKVRERTRAFNA